MLYAIQHFEIKGIASTLDFGAFVMKHPDFVSGKFDTNFVKKNWHSNEIKMITENEAMIAAWLTRYLLAGSDLKVNSIEY